MFRNPCCPIPASRIPRLHYEPHVCLHSFWVALINLFQSYSMTSKVETCRLTGGNHVLNFSLLHNGAPKPQINRSSGLQVSYTGQPPSCRPHENSNGSMYFYSQFPPRVYLPGNYVYEI